MQIMFGIFNKLEKYLCLRNEKEAGYEPILSLSSGWYYSSHKISQETSAGAGNSDFIWEESKLRRWWTHVPKNHLAWVRIQASFTLKSKGIKSNISWFRSASKGDVFISSSLQSFMGGPDQDISCELKQRYFSLRLISWEAEFPEMGHWV